MTKRTTKTSSTCYHCHEPVPAGLDLPVIINGTPQPMCCNGCAAVANMLASNNLDSFYQLRQQAAARPNARSEQWWQAFDDPELLDQLSDTSDKQTRSMTVNVSHLRCAACAWLLESCLHKLPGVEQLVVNYATGQGELKWRTDQTTLSKILIDADRLGYPMQPALLTTQKQQREQQRTSLRRLVVSALGMFQVMMMSVALYLGVAGDMQLAERDFFRWIALLLATPVVWYSGWPFMQAAWQQLRCMRPGMDVPVSLAILLAWGSSCINTFAGSGEVFFDSAVMFVFFLTISRHLEQNARLRAQAVSDRASQLLPLVVKRQMDNGDVETVQAMQLKVGDILLVEAGETLAADGILVSDIPVMVNESLLTGESQSMLKQPGDTLLAGSQVLDGAPRLQVTACGKQTTLAGIQQLMHKVSVKNNAVNWSGQLATWFTAGLLLLAAITAVWYWPSGWQHSLQVTLAVLVVSCPCALALAMPSVLASARARLARQGILLRDADILLRLPTITRIIADKTGTLTRGEFTLKQVIGLGDCLDKNTIREYATAIAMHSSHPLAQSLQSLKTSAEAQQLKEYAGQGLSAKINGKQYRLGKLDFVAQLSSMNPSTVRHSLGDSLTQSHSELWLGDSRQISGVILLGDQLKSNASEHLTDLNLPIVLLSGDHASAVAKVAAELNIDEAHAELLPDGKLKYLQSIQQAGDKVLAIGDGINDAPLLAAADVGVAIGTRHSLAKVAADILILHDDLSALPTLQNYAALTRQRIRQNLSWALLYNLSMIPIAMLGWLPPWLAALGMSLSSLLVVGNSLRMGPSKLSKDLQGDTEIKTISNLSSKPVAV